MITAAISNMTTSNKPPQEDYIQLKEDVRYLRGEVRRLQEMEQVWMDDYQSNSRRYRRTGQQDRYRYRSRERHRDDERYHRHHEKYERYHDRYSSERNERRHAKEERNRGRHHDMHEDIQLRGPRYHEARMEPFTPPTVEDHRHGTPEIPKLDTKKHPTPAKKVPEDANKSEQDKCIRHGTTIVEDLIKLDVDDRGDEVITLGEHVDERDEELRQAEEIAARHQKHF